MSVFSLPPFKDESLWLQAMTHRSFVNENPDVGEHNERLEFLGDAILTFVSGAYLYARYPDKPEGELTAIRAALVAQPQLCQFAQALNLGAHLRLGRGAEQQGARQRERLLCSAFEALLGARFLDCGQDISTVSSYVLPMFETVETQSVENATNTKSRLQEWAQKQSGGLLPEYRDVDRLGPDDRPQHVVEVLINGVLSGRGEGLTKQEASFKAAAAALRKIDEESSL